MSRQQRDNHKELRSLRRLWKMNFSHPPHSIDAMKAMLALKGMFGGGLIVGQMKCTRPNTIGTLTGISND